MTNSSTNTTFTATNALKRNIKESITSCRPTLAKTNFSSIPTKITAPDALCTSLPSHKKLNNGVKG